MRVCVCGSKDLDDYATVETAIIKSQLTIKELITGGDKGCGALAEQWANKNKIPIKQFVPEWNNLKGKDVEIRVGNWGEYNANAGKNRDQKILEYVDAVIGIGPSYLVSNAKDKNITVFEYDVRAEKQDGDYLYIFGSE